jgi:lactate dehydrogenase-like 2-hydroxyacid dehydrogenase
VTNTPDILTDDVADLGIALMLNVSRRINGAQKFIERGGWLSGTYPRQPRSAADDWALWVSAALAGRLPDSARFCHAHCLL